MNSTFILVIEGDVVGEIWRMGLNMADTGFDHQCGMACWYLLCIVLWLLVFVVM